MSSSDPSTVYIFPVLSTSVLTPTQMTQWGMTKVMMLMTIQATKKEELSHDLEDRGFRTADMR
jgi:hypothetical protein